MLCHAANRGQRLPVWRLEQFFNIQSQTERSQYRLLPCSTGPGIMQSRTIYYLARLCHRVHSFEGGTLRLGVLPPKNPESTQHPRRRYHFLYIGTRHIHQGDEPYQSGRDSNELPLRSSPTRSTEISTAEEEIRHYSSLVRVALPSGDHGFCTGRRGGPDIYYRNRSRGHVSILSLLFPWASDDNYHLHIHQLTSKLIDAGALVQTLRIHLQIRVPHY